MGSDKVLCVLGFVSGSKEQALVIGQKSLSVLFMDAQTVIYILTVVFILPPVDHRSSVWVTGA